MRRGGSLSVLDAPRAPQRNTPTCPGDKVAFRRAGVTDTRIGGGERDLVTMLSLLASRTLHQGSLCSQATTKKRIMRTSLSANQRAAEFPGQPIERLGSLCVVPTSPGAVLTFCFCCRAILCLFVSFPAPYPCQTQPSTNTSATGTHCCSQIEFPWRLWRLVQ